MPTSDAEPMQLSLIVPAYNEEKRLARMLAAYLPFFSGRYGHGFEMLVVVNGTSDGTATVAGGYSATFPQLKCIVESRRIGKGGAVMLGFGAAQGDLVGFVDADGSTPPEAFQDLVSHIGEAGAIIASRWLPGAQVSPRQPFSRRLASRLFNMMVRLVLGIKLSDTQCGAKLLKREAVRQILPSLGITQWAFDVDLLFQLRRAGYRIVEIPTAWHDVSGSRVKIIRASLEMFVAIVRLRLLYSPCKGIVDFYDRYIGRHIDKRK